MADIDYSGGSNVNIADGNSSGNVANVNSDNALRVVDVDKEDFISIWDRSTLTTTTTTVDQVVGTYTIPTGDTLVFDKIIMQAELTTPTGASTILGSVEFQVTLDGSIWVTLYTNVLRTGVTGPNTNEVCIPTGYGSSKLIGDGNNAFRMICTPASTTSTDWQFIIIGHTFDL